MSNNNQLNILQNFKKQALNTPTTNLTQFDSLVGIYLGTPVELHYAKKRDVNGKAIKGQDGKDLREESPTGYKITFSEYLTCKKILVVVNEIPESIKNDEADLTAFRISGAGYDIKGSMYFIEQNSIIENL